LALRFLNQLAPRWTRGVIPNLVADDQVLIAQVGTRLLARAPQTIRGRLEVRGIGIIDVPSVDQAELVLLVDLVKPEAVERLPDYVTTEVILGVTLPYLRVAPFEASAPLKLCLALTRVAAGELPASECIHS
jgi:serine kinase of HPr protein (carbohydrate metabolism regulator)